MNANHDQPRQADHQHGHPDHHDVVGAPTPEHGHLHEDEHPHRHASGPLGWIAGWLSPHSHDAADSIDDALAGSTAGIRAVKLSLLGLGLTALLQVVLVWVTGSVALVADTIHNFADASTAVPLWIAFSVSRWAATRRYTYGFGRAEDLAGVFVILMIATSAVVAAWESVQKLIRPTEVQYLGWVAVAGLIGFVGNELVALYRIRVGERIGSAALIADGYHARTDGLTSLAVLLAAGGVWLGFPLADPIIGLAITVAILFVLKGATVQIWARLMDAIDPALLAQAEAAAAQADGVQAVTGVRARWIGHSIFAEARIVADGRLTLSEAHAVAEEARHAMLHAVPKLASVIVHVDPAPLDGHDPHVTLAHHDSGQDAY